MAATRMRLGGAGRRRIIALAATAATVLAAAPVASADPRLGATAEITAVRGVVLVSKPGQRAAARVRRTQTVRLGSVIDATSGVVDVTTAKTPNGGVQTGRFKDGAFELTQSRGSRPYTILDLTKGDESACLGTAGQGGVTTAGRTTRRLWGRARGRFRTRGRSASATIRGTTWITEDTCQTTRVGAIEGEVEMASGEREVTVEDGEVWDFFCGDGFGGVPGDFSHYCQTLVVELPRSRTRREESGPLGSLSFGLSARANALPVPSTATACIRNLSSGVERCTDYPLKDDCDEFPDDFCQLRIDVFDICDAPRSTEYAVRWRVGDIELPLVQSGRTAKRDPFWDNLFDPAKPCAFSNNTPLPRFGLG